MSFTRLAGLSLVAMAAATSSFAAAPPVAPPATPSAGKYHCVFYIGGQGLQTVPGFTLATGSYKHDAGAGGTTRYKDGVIEFVGGALNGQAGKVERGKVHIFNERRDRTVIDCDTKG